MRIEFEGDLQDLIKAFDGIFTRGIDQFISRAQQAQSKTAQAPTKLELVNDDTEIPVVEDAETTPEPISKGAKGRKWNTKTKKRTTTTAEKAALISAYRKCFNSKRDIDLANLVRATAPNVPTASAESFLKIWLRESGFEHAYRKEHYRDPRHPNTRSRIKYTYLGALKAPPSNPRKIVL